MLKCLFRILVGVQLLCVVWPAAALSDEGGSARTAPQMIGVIPIGKSGISPALYRHADRLAPELKKLAPGKAVKLECRYNGVSSREKDVRKALLIAAEVKRYLHEIHNVRLNFWLTARFGAPSSADPAGLTFTLLPDDVAMLAVKPVVPTKVDAE